MGHVREDLSRTPLRFWPVFSYLIIYRSEARPIQILRVLHGARDVQSILDSE
jgi:antitoxin ParD1/3/4/toxin ParE1/3/4